MCRSCDWSMLAYHEIIPVTIDRDEDEPIDVKGVSPWNGIDQKLTRLLAEFERHDYGQDHCLVKQITSLLNTPHSLRSIFEEHFARDCLMRRAIAAIYQGAPIMRAFICKNQLPVNAFREPYPVWRFLYLGILVLGETGAEEASRPSAIR